MIYYSAYIRRDADGSRYSAIFQIAPDGSGNRQISQSFQGNILNLYYYPEKGKIYGLVGRNGSGKLIVVASHSSEDIRVLCDEIFHFDKGKMIDHQIAEK